MKIMILSLAVAIVISGCAGVNGFNPSELSGVSKNTTRIGFTSNHKSNMNDNYLVEYLFKHEDYAKFISEECLPQDNKQITDKRTALPVLIPIISSFGKYAYDSYIDKKMKKIEDLKKNAQKSYSAMAFLSLEELIDKSCLVLARYNENKKEKKYNLGLLYVAKILSKGKDAFVIQPVFIKAENAVALTAQGAQKKGEDTKSPPLIDTSFAISLKSIGTKKNGVPALMAVGEGVVSIPNLAIGPDAEAYRCKVDCPTSDLIPYPKVGAKTLSISASVTETGKIGIDLDERTSSLKAIKEAMGPALKDAIKESMAED